MAADHHIARLTRRGAILVPTGDIVYLIPRVDDRPIRLGHGVPAPICHCGRKADRWDLEREIAAEVNPSLQVGASSVADCMVGRSGKVLE